VLQALLAGFAAAQAAAISASDFAAVICHASADRLGDASDPSIPDANKTWHLCCVACTASTAATPPPPGLALVVPTRAVSSVPYQHRSVAFARGVVRAGPTRAPPLLL